MIGERRTNGINYSYTLSVIGTTISVDLKSFLLFSVFIFNFLGTKSRNSADMPLSVIGAVR